MKPFVTCLLCATLVAVAVAQTAPQSPPSGDDCRRHFFAFSKSMVRNPVAMQQRGHDAVRRIGEGAERLGFAIHVIQEHVRDLEQFRREPSPFLVTAEVVRNELGSYGRKLGTNDTIIVYSHSHGSMDRAGHPGGLPLDDPGVGRPKEPPLAWSAYAEQLLSLPAKTVVVLTMACHSGGLVDFLNRDEKAQRLWQDRREHGRNFLVITSQNARAMSNPRRIDGEIINPFTYAVIRAFGGVADGYRRGSAERRANGALTLGEFADFVVDETRKHTRANDGANDPDPQVTGSFDSDFVIGSPFGRRDPQQVIGNDPEESVGQRPTDS